MPDFFHTFEPPGVSSLGGTAELTVREIEDAGLREILQTPGVAFGNWGLLSALLDANSPYFVFREALGQAREVKTAVSGLFGRFVARAYATRHLGYSHFFHLHRLPMRLTGPTGGFVRRVPGTRGDLPDWVVWSKARGLGIIEAKGCHDTKGPQAALMRAYNQAERAEIMAQRRRASFKRYAIATRWGFASSSSMTPQLAVKDPDVDGVDVTPEEVRGLGLGVIRRHYASLLRTLGHAELASALVQLTAAPFHGRQIAAQNSARAALERAKVSRVEVEEGKGPADVLIGGVVVREGLLPSVDLSFEDQRTLTRLQMRPTFVGIEKRALAVAIEGSLDDADDDQPVNGEADSSEAISPSQTRDDWVVRLEEDHARLS